MVVQTSERTQKNVEKVHHWQYSLFMECAEGEKKRMKRIGFLAVGLLCCFVSVKAQYSMGNTGLLNIPSADMQETGTFMGGGNYLPEGMTPFAFDTGNYFVNITFLSILELSYRCTLLKT